MPPRDHRHSTDNPHEARLLGVRVDLLTVDDLNTIVEQAVGEPRRVVIGNYNLHGVYLHHRSPEMRSFESIADYVHMDGMPIVWWAKILGHPAASKHRVSYLDWLDPLMTLAAGRSWKVFYLGSKPGVAAKGAAILEQKYDGVRIAHHHGYFDAAPGSLDNEDILRSIRDFDPDLLMVGMGQPRQETWIVDHLGQISARAILNAGACIDYVAGVIPTPPRWMGKLGLEWLFRLASEPRRLATRYLVEPWALLPLFVEDLRRRRSSGPDPS
jgi:N-acetylglucosaminyldiphosphoundecaprenol N-acetyl-beta-D-mannosaminyltransferase